MPLLQRSLRSCALVCRPAVGGGRRTKKDARSGAATHSGSTWPDVFVRGSAATAIGRRWPVRGAPGERGSAVRICARNRPMARFRLFILYQQYVVSDSCRRKKAPASAPVLVTGASSRRNAQGCSTHRGWHGPGGGRWHASADPSARRTGLRSRPRGAACRGRRAAG